MAERDSDPERISAEIDAPADEAGVWHLDVWPGAGSPWIVVEWKPDLGFGVSTPGADDYGTKPDELYPNARAAYDRLIQLLPDQPILKVEKAAIPLTKDGDDGPFRSALAALPISLADDTYSHGPPSVVSR